MREHNFHKTQIICEMRNFSKLRLEISTKTMEKPRAAYL